MASGLAKTVTMWLKEANEDKMVSTWDANIVKCFPVEDLSLMCTCGGRRENSIIHELAKHGKAKVLKHLVQSYGFDINVQRQRDGSTPLHLAFWHEHEALAQCLMELGADQHIKNWYGEDCIAVAAIGQQDKPVSVRLQGAHSAGEVLEIVKKEAANLSASDTVKAYHRLAQLLGRHDPQLCKWSTTSAATRIMETTDFQSLCTASVEALQHSTAPELWIAMLAALCMLPHTHVIEELFQHLQRNPLPLGSFNNHELARMTWCVAKIPSSNSLRPLFSASLKLWGLELLQRIRQAPENVEGVDIADVAWAYAKAGVHHSDLFRAIAEYLGCESHDLSSMTSQSISMIAWSFARLGENNHALALGDFGKKVVELVPDFDDQQVSNSLWGFARLGLGIEKLFIALFKRADEMMFNPVYRYHEKRASFTKDMQWMQIYSGYKYCCRSCPESVSSLSRRLATKLQEIDAQFLRDDVSDGSVSESVISSTKLDAMIANMEDLIWSPGDSLEANVVEPSQEVVSINDGIARMLLETPSSKQDTRVLVVLLKFARSPEPFKKALLDGDELKSCIQALRVSGFEPKLESGAKIFVRPEHYEAVLATVALKELTLFTSHVLVAEEFLPCVLTALSAVPGKCQLQKPKRCMLSVAHTEESAESAISEAINTVSERLQKAIKHTFIHLNVPSSLYSTKPARAANSQ